MVLYTLIPVATCPIGAVVTDDKGSPVLDAEGRPTRQPVPLITTGPAANYSRRSIAYHPQSGKVVINDGTGAPVMWATSGNQGTADYINAKIVNGRKTKENPNGSYALAAGWVVGESGMLPEGAVKALNLQLAKPGFAKDGTLQHGFRLLTNEELASLPATGGLNGPAEDDEEEVMAARRQNLPNAPVRGGVQLGNRPAANNAAPAVNEELMALRAEVEKLRNAETERVRATEKAAAEKELADLRAFKAAWEAKVQADKEAADKAAADKLAADLAELAELRSLKLKADVVPAKDAAAASGSQGAKTGTK